MDKILIVGCSAEQKKRLIDILGNNYIVDYCIDAETAYKILVDINHGYALVLLCMDLLSSDGLDLLAIMSTHPDLISIPAVIVTEQPPKDEIAEAIDRGAYDYVNLNAHPRLIFHRIRNIIEALKGYSPKLEAMNTYMFHHCIGAAMLLEVEGDKIHGLMINENFYTLLGFKKEEFDQYKSNLMKTVLSDEINDVRNAIQKATETGSAECIMSNVESAKSFRVTYHRIGNAMPRTIFLCTIVDITSQLHSKEISDAMLCQPGVMFYDYDVKSDTTNLYIMQSDGNPTNKRLKNDLESNKQGWISPESYNYYKQSLLSAITEPCSGSLEILANISGAGNTWHRIYYRSIADRNGFVYRVVGRIDDLEHNTWSGIKEEHLGICDVESNLLTYNAVNRFIDSVIAEKKQGILLLLDISGLNRMTADMSVMNRQAFIRGIVQHLKELFKRTDIMGRFGEEGFIIFMPDTSNTNIAQKRAGALIDTISRNLRKQKFRCNVGISIVDENHMSAASVISDANIALWEAKEIGNREFVIF